MSRPPKEGFTWALAGALALPAVVFPVYNPDLFWHLSAGRWIAEYRALPRADFLSLTQAGKPWLDFEWLSQLFYYGAYAVAGMWGLWLLKGVLVAAALFAFLSLLRALGTKPLLRPAALGFFSAALLPYADARPDLFSLILLAWLLRRLELKTLRPLESFALFALWASLHGGFALGLAALALYAAAAWLVKDRTTARARLLCLVAAAAGACANPYGFGPYVVVWRHWAARGLLAGAVKEWAPLGFSNPLYWPAWALLALLAVAAAVRFVKRSGRAPSWPLLGLAAYLAVATLQHERAVSFFGLVGAAALATLAPAWEDLATVALGALAAFYVWLAPRVLWTPPFNPKYAPVGAASFLAGQRPTAERWRAYNQWEWGGYLGFRLAPWYRVSSDGRYLFHEQHAEEGRAAESAAAWDSYLREHGYDAALAPNLGRRFPTQRRYPDGSLKAFERPWYLFYFPRERWALVYWDAQALLFVDRGKADARWLAEHEYHWLRPGDDAAFADALGRREIPLDAVAREKERQRREAALSGGD